MAKVPLISGAYEAKSLIAECQRCINLYPEKNPQDAPFPTTHYQTPGLDLLVASDQAGWRGLYTASNNVLYGVCGQTVYRINSDFTLTQLGQITSEDSLVTMVDNGTSIILVDGSAGYTIGLSGNTFAPINQDSFYGGNTVQYADGFFILPRPGTNQYYISLDFQTTFDATDFASKVGFSDLLVTLVVTKLYIYLLGAETSEVWFNAGNATFPYARMPGAFIQHGIIAPQSAAQMDGSVYWLSQSPQGKCVAMRTENYNAQPISTNALENEWQSYPRVDDAFGYTRQMEGHWFYVLTFPTADKTWVYDLLTQAWHEWLWLDDEGQFHRHRGNCYSFAYGKPIVGDWENGNLYMLNPDTYQDNGAPISRLRSFPHMVDDSNRVMYREFIADMQVGTGDDFESEPLYLRWSDTRGASWGNAISTSISKEGEYLTSLQYQRLGYARDRVFELSWSANMKTALNGAYVQVIKANE